MSLNLTKTIFGSVLLFLGVAIIFYSLYSSYNIFTAKTPAPEIFSTEVKTNIVKAGSQDLQAQLQKMLEDQLKGLLPANSIPVLLNLASWSILACVLIFGGSQIAGLGIKLLK